MRTTLQKSNAIACFSWSGRCETFFSVFRTKLRSRSLRVCQVLFFMLPPPRSSCERITPGCLPRPMACFWFSFFLVLLFSYSLNFYDLNPLIFFVGCGVDSDLERPECKCFFFVHLVNTITQFREKSRGFFNFLHPLQGRGKGQGGRYPVAIVERVPALAARIHSSVAHGPLLFWLLLRCLSQLS